MYYRFIFRLRKPPLEGVCCLQLVTEAITIFIGQRNLVELEPDGLGVLRLAHRHRQLSPGGEISGNVTCAQMR